MEGLGLDGQVLQGSWKGRDGGSGKKWFRETKQSGDLMVPRGPYVLLVIKGGGDMGWGKLSLRGFEESGGCPVVGQGPGLEGLEGVKQEPWSRRPAF